MFTMGEPGWGRDVEGRRWPRRLLALVWAAVSLTGLLWLAHQPGQRPVLLPAPVEAEPAAAPAGDPPVGPCGPPMEMRADAAAGSSPQSVRYRLAGEADCDGVLAVVAPDGAMVMSVAVCDGNGGCTDPTVVPNPAGGGVVATLSVGGGDGYELVYEVTFADHGVVMDPPVWLARHVDDVEPGASARLESVPPDTAPEA